MKHFLSLLSVTCLLTCMACATTGAPKAPESRYMEVAFDVLVNSPAGVDDVGKREIEAAARMKGWYVQEVANDTPTAAKADHIKLVIAPKGERHKAMIIHNGRAVGAIEVDSKEGESDLELFSRIFEELKKIQIQ